MRTGFLSEKSELLLKTVEKDSLFLYKMRFGQSIKVYKKLIFECYHIIVSYTEHFYKIWTCRVVSICRGECNMVVNL